MTQLLDQLEQATGRAERAVGERPDLLHKGVVLGSSILAGIGARKALAALWRRSSEPGQPPLTPGGDTTWQRALTWAVSSGVAAGVSRLVARRLAVRAVGAR